MSLLEEMSQKRREATSVAEEELNEVVEKIKNAFKDWQEHDIDRSCFKMYVCWDEGVLKLETAEDEKTEKYSVTEEIKSKKKRQIMFDNLEKKLTAEGVDVNRKDMTRNKERGEISFLISVAE